MNLLLLLSLLAQTPCNIVSTTTVDLDDYRHCILSVQVERHEAYHTQVVSPQLSDHDTRISLLESWQVVIKIILGIGSGGGVGLGVHGVRRWRRNHR